MPYNPWSYVPESPELLNQRIADVASAAQATIDWIRKNVAPGLPPLLIEAHLQTEGQRAGLRAQELARESFKAMRDAPVAKPKKPAKKAKPAPAIASRPRGRPPKAKTPKGSKAAGLNEFGAPVGGERTIDSMTQRYQILLAARESGNYKTSAAKRRLRLQLSWCRVWLRDHGVDADQADGSPYPDQPAPAVTQSSPPEVISQPVRVGE